MKYSGYRENRENEEDEENGKYEGVEENILFANIYFFYYAIA